MKKKKESTFNMSKINKLADLLKKGTDNLYKNTYFSNTDNNNDLNIIKNNLNKSLDNIIDNNVDNIGVSNISQLYQRLSNDDKNKEDISTFLENDYITSGLLSSFSDNVYLEDYDNDIDLICKYMPSLGDSLDAKKDNVLCADHFSKDFINVINKSNITNINTFNDRIDFLKKKYNLTELFDNIYDNTAKYGEQFIYIKPYNEALKNLVDDTIESNAETLTESFNSNDILNECKNKDELNIDKDYKLDLTINVEINKSGVLYEAVNDHKTAIKFNEKIVPDDASFEGLDSQEGLISKSPTKSRENINVKGCIVKRLKRTNVIPVYIDDLCLGYYYLECMDTRATIFRDHQNTLNDPISSFNFNKISNGLEQDLNQLNTLKLISSKLSKYIDSKFINANQDLSKEIYLILKLNQFTNNKKGNLKVTFIPPSDMVHVTFQKDQITHRGISDLDKSIIPAKLFICLYITNTLGILTRSHDKRVYYVKQNVDTNISKVLLNTINQIKKSNFGTRELSNIKNMLNVTGRYNDLIIPLGPTGDAPVQFEVMPGQQIDTNQDLLDVLEQMAINATDVPYEYIQSRKNVDYAVRLTMSSGKFLRTVFKRQAVCEVFFSRILNILYNYEYDNDDIIEVILPPPAFLNILETNQMLQNVEQCVEAVVNMMYPNGTGDEENDNKTISRFTSKLKQHYLSTYLDMKSIKILLEQSKMEIAAEKKNTDDQM